jgi:hypothetical protein
MNMQSHDPIQYIAHLYKCDARTESALSLAHFLNTLQYPNGISPANWTPKMIRTLLNQIGLVANDKRESLKNPSERMRVNHIQIRVAEILDSLPD